MIFALEAVSLVIVAIVAVAVLAHGGYGGGTLRRVSYHPFSPAGVPAGTLGLGIVFAFTGFSGFEVARCGSAPRWTRSPTWPPTART